MIITTFLLGKVHDNIMFSEIQYAISSLRLNMIMETNLAFKNHTWE